MAPVQLINAIRGFFSAYLIKKNNPDQVRVFLSYFNLIDIEYKPAVALVPGVLSKEMLDDDTGIILAGNDENELASRAMYLLENEELRKKMSRNAFLKTRNTTWGKVAGKHNQVFREILGTSFDTQAMPGQVIH